jgi:hypothetical protein
MPIDLHFSMRLDTFNIKQSKAGEAQDEDQAGVYAE